jgi:hypothetical protein
MDGGCGSGTRGEHLGWRPWPHGRAFPWRRRSCERGRKGKGKKEGADVADDKRDPLVSGSSAD